MPDKNTLTAGLLMLLVFLIYAWYTKPTEAELKKAKDKHDSIARVEAQKSDTSLSKLSTDTLSDIDTTHTAITTSAINKSGLFNGNTTPSIAKLENKVIAIDIASQGAQIRNVTMKNYKNHDGSIMIMRNNKADKFGIEFYTSLGRINTADLNFEKINESDNTVTMIAYADSSKLTYIEFKYQLDSTYLIGHNIRMVGLNNLIQANSTGIDLLWSQRLNQQEAILSNERNWSTVYFKESEVDFLSESNETEEAKLGKTEWVSFKQVFFNTALINKQQFIDGTVNLNYKKEDISYNKDMSAKLVLPYNNQSEINYPLEWYIGPNKYSYLNAMDNEMQLIMPLGWGIFRWINSYIIIPIFNFLSKYINSYGIIILILTIIIKLAVFPLSYRTFVSSAKMRLLKPDIDKLKEKYGNDPQKLQMEQMAMQSKSGVSPFGGCLPQLLQLPIWIALFRFFPASIEFRQQPFLWAQDLSSFDSIISIGGFHISLFCLLFCVSQILMTWYMSKTTEIPEQMKYLQYFFPVMMFFFLNSTSSGLNWYMLASNIITFLTQFISMRYLIDEAKLQEQIQTNRSKPQTKSGLQKRLEEAIKKQEEMKKRKK